ncbi:hypothetical protein J6590_045039 [Homalodisca vitripennis]|nr:hypothetical protein J6590_045039 [Homalodisca vitripennis]
MSWHCFTDHNTGRVYKSRLAVADSTTDLSGRPVTGDYDLRELVSAARLLENGRNSGRVLRRLWCDQHGPSTTPDDDGRRSYTATCTTTTNNTRTYTDILLVGFDASVLPPIINWFDSVGDVRQDYFDERRRRDECASRIETLRRSLPAGSNRTLQFIIAYGEEAKRRTVDTLRGMKCRFTETPTFQTTGDFYDHTITDSSVVNVRGASTNNTEKVVMVTSSENAENAVSELVGTTNLRCSGSEGLVKTLTKRGPTCVWECTNYTGYTDSGGKLLGGNCSGGGGIISYDGHLYCECPPTIDSVTGTNRLTVRMDVNGMQLCVSNQDLYEVD